MKDSTTTVVYPIGKLVNLKLIHGVEHTYETFGIEKEKHLELKNAVRKRLQEGEGDTVRNLFEAVFPLCTDTKERLYALFMIGQFFESYTSKISKLQQLSGLLQMLQ